MTDDLKTTSAPPRLRYIANGALDTYTFNFKIFDPEDIRVYLGDMLLEGGYTTEKDDQSDGGKVIFKTPPAEGTKITLMRHLVFERLSDFQEGGALRAKTLNNELDYQTACLQQLDDKISRTIMFPPYMVSEDVNLQLPAPVAGKALIWNDVGSALKNSASSIDTAYEACKSFLEEANTAKNIVLETKVVIEECYAKIKEFSENTDFENLADKSLSNLTEEGLSRFDNKFETKAQTDASNFSDEGKAFLNDMTCIDLSRGISYADTEVHQALSCGYLIMETGNNNISVEMNVKIGETNEPNVKIAECVQAVNSYKSAQASVVKIPKNIFWQASNARYQVTFYPVKGA